MCSVSLRYDVVDAMSIRLKGVLSVGFGLGLGSELKKLSSSVINRNGETIDTIRDDGFAAMGIMFHLV